MARSHDRFLPPAHYRLKFAHFPYIGSLVADLGKDLGTVPRVLDVGCGPGNLPILAGTDVAARWVGTDLWPHQLHQAAEKGVYESLHQVNLVHGLPIKDGVFDAVVCGEVLMYVPNDRELLREFHRVLRKGGLLCVYNPVTFGPKTARNLKKLGRMLFRDRSATDFDLDASWKDTDRAARITYYSLWSLTHEVTDAGFSVAEVRGFRIFRNRIRLMNHLEKLAWYRNGILELTRRYPWLAADILVHARKASDSKEQAG